MLRFALAIAAAAFAISQLPARAEDKPSAATEILQGVTVAQMEEIMGKAGYQAKVGVDSDNLPVIDSKASGMNFWVYFYNCDGEPKTCRRVQFQTSLKTDMPMQDKAMDWNNKKVAGRAANSKDTTYFDYLVDCGGGVTPDNLSQNLERFDAMMSEFATFIGWR